MRQRGRSDEDFNAEILSHIDLETDRLIHEGYSREEASATAIRKFGNVVSVRERFYESQRVLWFSRAWLESLWQDGRYAVRSVRSRRWGSLAAVGMLALAIGITTAMFTIVDALILRPIPFKNPEQLANLSMRGEHGGPPSVISPVYRAWRESNAFTAVEAVSSSAYALVGSPGGEVVRNTVKVTPGMFDLLGGVRPLRGRLFDASEGRPGQEDRVLISEDIWNTLYHSDPGLVGHTITIDGKAMVVVGILPAEFRFPNWDTVIWMPRDSAAVDERPMVYVRFAANVPTVDALRVATTAAIAADPKPVPGFRAVPHYLTALEMDSYYARAVPLLSGGVVLLFFVLCANVSSLLLAGLTARAKELGTRAALGASRVRLLRQALLEAAIVGLGGIAGGMFMGWALVSLLHGILPQAGLLQSLNPLNIDVRALAATSIAGLIATLAAGLLPAVIGTRINAITLLQIAGRGNRETPRARVITRVLLVGQIALSCTLLIGATMLVRSFLKIVYADRGLDTSNVLIARIFLPPASFGSPESRTGAYRALEDEARALPGVKYAAWSYGTPPGGGINPTCDWSSDETGAFAVNMQANQFIIDSDFFRVYDIPILKGRSFQPLDDQATAVVSERFANALWPGVDPIGRTFSCNGRGNSAAALPHSRVVGVIREIHYPSLNRNRDAPQMYIQRELASVAMLSMRCTGKCPDAVLVRQRLAAAQPGVQLDGVWALEDAYFREFARPRAASALAFTFAATALIAAAAGLFSLLSDSVSRRRREFGIRTTLGASPSSIRQLVWRDGLALTLAGIGIGTLAGVWLQRLLSSLLFEVTVTDYGTWAIVTGVLAITIAAASWRPTRAAVNTAPMDLLRTE